MIADIIVIRSGMIYMSAIVRTRADWCEQIEIHNCTSIEMQFKSLLAAASVSGSERWRRYSHVAIEIS